ncbi:MAG: MarR family winged helix-turn-helix transcriptional regulator [Eubacteriales bacterium]
METIRELLQVFVRRFGLLDASCTDNCCGEEISLVQSHILHEITRQTEPSMLQVAEALGVDITTFSRQIKTLVRKGLVKKTTDPEDRRIQLLSLTPEGQRVKKEIDLLMERYMEKIFSKMTEFEREMVLRSIKLLNEAILKSGSCCS